ncbi:MAG: gamma-glutamyl-phosphate reductase, partial [Candidatus Wallbacteria bacterium]|nr:gamma-glutamyl-phosphate reductase [Candidatus Wallbacteria bacterium]
MDPADSERLVAETCKRANEAARKLAQLGPQVRSRALEAMALGLREETRDILAANARDVSESEAAGKPVPFLDRLRLDPARIQGMAQAIEEVARQPDPV